MRMRRKKNLDERIAACKPVMLYMQCQNEHAGDPLSEEFFADSEKVFGNSNPLFLEIGCGKGGFAIEFARQNPDINLIALEKTKRSDHGHGGGNAARAAKPAVLPWSGRISGAYVPYAFR